MSRPNLNSIAEAFIAALPYARDLAMAVRSVKDGHAVVEMPWSADLVGDPSSGVIHGGAVSALIDTTCGAAVICHPENGGETATLNLRIDYMRAASPGATLVAHATCYHVTQNVAFVRAEAVDGTEDTPVASAAAAFTFQRRGTS